MQVVDTIVDDADKDAGAGRIFPRPVFFFCYFVFVGIKLNEEGNRP
jgi:hypothetical protein